MNKIYSTLWFMSNDTTGSSYISHHLLVAMPGLLDPIFSKSVVYLAEHSGEGAMGIVINKPCELDLWALLTKLNLGSRDSQEGRGVSEPVYYGGPIQQDRGFVLHEPASTWTSTLKINVTENDPYAIYFQEGKSFLIDLDGSIITEINLNNYEDDLLFVRGENSPELLEQLIRDISIAFPNLTQTLEEVEFIEKRRWNLKLNNKLLVKLPDENIQQSLKNLKQLFEEQEVMESNIIEIDLRIQGRAALKVLDGKINYGIDEI